ncbi:unnamed protein product, partial [Pleuronectes platessa]
SIQEEHRLGIDSMASKSKICANGKVRHKVHLPAQTTGRGDKPLGVGGIRKQPDCDEVMQCPKTCPIGIKLTGDSQLFLVLSQLLGASWRVPPAVAVAEVIREKGPTRVQSGRRMRTSRCRTLSLRRRGEEGRRSNCSPSRGTCPAAVTNSRDRKEKEEK